MASETKTNQPEVARNRHVNGRQTYLSFPSEPMPHGIQIIFKEYSYSGFVVNNRGLNKTKPEVSGTRSIELPFPRTMTDSTGVRVASFERNFLTERIAASLAGQTGTSLGQIGQNVMNMAGAAASAMQAGASAFAKNPGMALQAVTGALSRTTGESAANMGRLASFIIRNFLPEELSKSVAGVTGMAINPNETLAFEGVDLKSYTFTWDLYPTTPRDSEQIEQIIRLVKREALPRYSAGGLTTLGPFGTDAISVDRVFLKYPSVAIINLLGVNELRWQRFKPAMMTNVTVDYAAGGTMGIMRGGSPAGVNLSLSFTELSIHTAEDYDYATYMGTTPGGTTGFADPGG